MSNPIRVLCVDDSPDLADVIAATLNAEDDLKSVGVLMSADNLCEEVTARGADVVLIDLTMPGRDPLDAIGEMIERCPDSRAVVMSGYDDKATIDAAMDRGAWGFVSKHSDITQMLKAIRAVSQGSVFIDHA